MLANPKWHQHQNQPQTPTASGAASATAGFVFGQILVGAGTRIGRNRIFIHFGPGVRPGIILGTSIIGTRILGTAVGLRFGK